MVNMADSLVPNDSSQRQDYTNMHLFTEYQREHDIQMVPKPTVHSWKADLLKSALPDPKLSLTPERSSKLPSLTVGKPNTQTTCIKTVASKSKLKQKVRFEIDEEDDNDADVEIVVQEQTHINSDNLNANCSSGTTAKKAYCPQMYVNKSDYNPSSDKDLDVTHTEENSNSVYSEPWPQSIEYSETTKALKFLAIRESAPVKSDLPVIIDSVPAHARKCHAVKNVVVTREFENGSDPSDYKFPFVDPGQFLEPEHVFARPEFNSTLKISEELKDLKAEKPKVVETLKQKLKHSEETRCEINEKASVKVNQSKDVFGGLVQVQPDINRLCLEVERETTFKSKSKAQKNANMNFIKRPDGSVCDVKVPDILEFYTENRQKEIPDFNLSGIQIPEINLLGADNATAFDIYRHNKVWETLNN